MVEAVGANFKIAQQQSASGYFGLVEAAAHILPLQLCHFPSATWGLKDHPFNGGTFTVSISTRHWRQFYTTG